MMKIEKCLHASHYNALKANTFNKDSVLVFYGTNSYKRTVEYIHNIVMAIKEDFPEMSIQDMEIYEISKVQSNRRAGCTMICVYVDVGYVWNHFEEFSIL